IGRLASIAKDEKISADAIEAVSAIGVIDPDEFLLRARALDEARQNEPELFEDLATAYARAAHLSEPELGVEIDDSLLTEPEQTLLTACEEGEKEVTLALSQSDFAGAVAALSKLREPIDSFFDKVLVMDNDATVRRNRLRLLNKFAQVFSDVADISVLSRKK
ncbi:MAG: glycine--tRNA ligase subunit beta, partial [Atopobiaceae bacterium]|nr:glycine--tRNA ligase subunit beta [Atopobiaceae bacterium]